MVRVSFGWWTSARLRTISNVNIALIALSPARIRPMICPDRRTGERGDSPHDVEDAGEQEQDPGEHGPATVLHTS